MTTPYGISVTLRRPFTATVEAARAALAEQGFGILMEADLQATFQKKLQQDSLPHVILGACAPATAFEALKVDPNLGLLLPCNVAVRAVDNGVTSVAAVDPVVMLGLTGKAELESAAADIRARLARALETLEKQS